MSGVKVVGLTGLNVAALREVLAAEVQDRRIVTTATTATFYLDDPVEVIQGAMRDLPTRGHPRASLHAVVRKIKAVQEVQA